MHAASRWSKGTCYFSMGQMLSMRPAPSMAMSASTAGMSTATTPSHADSPSIPSLSALAAFLRFLDVVAAAAGFMYCTGAVQYARSGCISPGRNTCQHATNELYINCSLFSCISTYLASGLQSTVQMITAADDAKSFLCESMRSVLLSLTVRCAGCRCVIKICHGHVAESLRFPVAGKASICCSYLRGDSLLALGPAQALHCVLNTADVPTTAGPNHMLIGLLGFRS